MFDDWHMQKQHQQRAQLCFERSMGETGPLNDVAPGAEAWRKEKRPEKKTMCRLRSDPAAQIVEVSYAVHVRMGDVKEWRQSGHAQINWNCREDPSQQLPLQ